MKNKFGVLVRQLTIKENRLLSVDSKRFFFYWDGDI